MQHLILHQAEAGFMRTGVLACALQHQQQYKQRHASLGRRETLCSAAAAKAAPVSALIFTAAAAGVSLRCGSLVLPVGTRQRQIRHIAYAMASALPLPYWYVCAPLTLHGKRSKQFANQLCDLPPVTSMLGQVADCGLRVMSVIMFVVMPVTRHVIVL
jgi:hypothetical protein